MAVDFSDTILLYNDAMISVLHIAIPSLLLRCLDYLPNQQKVQPGMRVKIPLRNKTSIGIVISEEHSTPVPLTKLKPIIAVIDKEAIIPANLLSLLKWIAHYYHYPISGVLKVALPRLLRKAKPLSIDMVEVWRVRRARLPGHGLPSTAVKQRALLEWLGKLEDADKTLLDIEFKNWRAPLKILEQKGLVERRQVKIKKQAISDILPPRHQLNAAQRGVVEAMLAECNGFSCSLLEGVTGSGKTEVYLELCEFIIKQQKQVLVLVPEIALTIQTVARFRERFGQSVPVFHSRLTDTERMRTWSVAADGTARVVIGTRSASFLVFKKLGLIIVDEEHDSAYKQLESLRYHARDVAIKRAQLEDLPVLLGSATPSLETLHNVACGRYRHYQLRQRAGGAAMPHFRIIDVRRQRLDGGLSKPLIRMVNERLKRREQVLLFINRRGYAPIMICRQCGATIECRHCDARMVYHKSRGELRCHHCDFRMAPPSQCPQCQSKQLATIGIGTQKIEEKVRSLFPEARVLRIDTDAVRRKGVLSEYLEQIHSRQVDIIIGTQILTKGHHLPALTLTCMVDVDQGLFSVDFRSTEKLAQMITQVGGRTGRGDVAGEVILQTHQPHHPVLHTLLKKGYSAVSSALLLERKQAELPPYRHYTLLSVEARQLSLNIAFLNAVERHAKSLVRGTQVCVYPPIAAVMEKKANYHRARMLFQALRASDLNHCIRALIEKIETLPSRRNVRWYFDVDPQEID